MKRFVPFLVVLFVIAAILQIDFFFAIVYLFFGIYVLSRIWVARSLRQLQMRRDFVHRAFPGDTIPVKVTVDNPAWIPVPWLEIHESLPVALIAQSDQHEVVSLRARTSRYLKYDLRCRRRGYHRIGPLMLRTGDLLGILPERRTQLPPENLIIYPQIVPLHQLGIPTHAPQPVLKCTTPLFEDPARVMGVRDYHRGDSPRRIHWSASASAGRLLVKQFEPAVSRETLVCLDLDADHYGRRQRYTATELAIVTAASVVNHIVTDEGLPVGLTTRAIDPLTGDEAEFSLLPRSERTHLMDILEILARVEVTSNTSFDDLLRRRSSALPWGATVVIITGGQDQPLMASMTYLQRRGFTPVLMLVQPGLTGSQIENRAEVLGIRTFRIWRTDDLEGLV
jgi:uncharacterized protein (DUF58 family)